MVKLFWVCLFVAVQALPATAACRLALILAVDVSASVDGREYRLQLDGIAQALSSDEVRAQLLALPQIPIHLTIFEWSDTGHQTRIQDWVALRTQSDLEAVAAKLRAHNSPRRAEAATAIGSALLHAKSLFETGPDCARKTIDISGDGVNNQGPEPARLHTTYFEGITINGLVIVPALTTGRAARHMEVLELSAYFRRRVIHGPGSFIELAWGFDDYTRAMTRKLLRETELPPIGFTPRAVQPRYAVLH